MSPADLATNTLGLTSGSSSLPVNRVILRYLKNLHFVVDLDDTSENGGVLVNLPFPVLDDTGDQGLGAEEDTRTAGTLCQVPQYKIRACRVVAGDCQLHPNFSLPKVRSRSPAAILWREGDTSDPFKSRLIIGGICCSDSEKERPLEG